MQYHPGNARIAKCDKKAFFESFKHHWSNCLQNYDNRMLSKRINDVLALLPNQNEKVAREDLEIINFIFDNFNMHFPKLTYKLIIDFCQGSVEKFSSEFYNLKNFDWDQMGATLIVWQQKNIIQNPLCNFDVQYDYKTPIINLPAGPVKRTLNKEMEKVRIVNVKHSKTRRANNDMSAKFCMDARTEKVFYTF